MKKLLLSSAALALGLALSAPAHAATANGITVNAGGQFNGYVVWGRQSTSTGNEDRTLFILRDTEVNLTGEDTLDNGLTVGVYNEFNIDGNQGLDNQFGAINGGTALENVGTVSTKESYAYFSGAWGRVNFGKEDGASYLLQVAAPSADSNIDGLRQLVNPVNYALTSAAGNYAS
jgi:outer membrane protein OmpU